MLISETNYYNSGLWAFQICFADINFASGYKRQLLTQPSLSIFPFFHMAIKMNQILSRAFILFSALSISAVSSMAFQDPQSVDLVHVNLPNNDAYSSIRGAYGGAGFAIAISLIYSFSKHTQKALAFLMLLWVFYALSRLLTIVQEGPLGHFGNFWIKAESMLFLIACALYVWTKQSLRPGKSVEQR